MANAHLLKIKVFFPQKEPNMLQILLYVNHSLKVRHGYYTNNIL